MKTLLNIILINTIVIANLIGQNNEGQMRERMEAQKIAFITKKLNLNTQESQNFWPIYNEYQAENKELAQVRNKNKTDLMTMSDQEAQELFDQMLDAEYKKLEIRKKYADRMMGVIGSKRVLMLINIEDQFKRELLENFKRRMNSKQGGNRTRGMRNGN